MTVSHISIFYTLPRMLTALACLTASILLNDIYLL